MPLTRDARIIELFAAEMVPEIMPVEGEATQEAVALADQQLTAAGVAGSIVLVTGGVPKDQIDGLTARAPVYVLDTFAPDNSDVRRVASRIEQSLVVVQTPDGGERWRDGGYWLVPLIALLSLIWFRPGWTVTYS